MEVNGVLEAVTNGPVFTLATGPVGSTPATSAALAQPVLHHTDPAFRALYAETVALLRQAFATSTDPVIFPGEAVVGLEATAAAMIGPGDVVLNVVSGLYGRIFGQLARRFARAVIDVETSNRASIEPAAVQAALNARRDVTIVAAVHCETPSGTLNDIGAIGEITARSGALLIVDAVSSFGGGPTDFERWPAGVAVTAPQKALGGTPGLSLLHVSADAWRHIEANQSAPRGSALSILDWRDAHRPDRAFPFTPPVTDIYGLREVLRQYLQEGPENAHERHHRAARAVRAGVPALGLRLWADEAAIKADTVTAVELPDGVDEAEVRALARAESGVMLAGGQGDLKGRVLQIGHMGPAAYPLSPVIALTALGRALRRLGAKADIGAAVEAALAANDGEQSKSLFRTVPCSARAAHDPLPRLAFLLGWTVWAAAARPSVSWTALRPPSAAAPEGPLLNGSLKGQTVLVIGRGSGIARAVALATRDAGAAVIAAGRDQEKLSGAYAGEPGISIDSVDLTDEDSIAALGERLEAVDHVVSTASARARGRLADLNRDALRLSFDTKVLGPLMLAKHLAPRMNEGGSFVFFSGVAAVKIVAGTLGVAITNAAADTLVRSLALELGPIRVNAISPGTIDTGAWDALGQSGKADFFAATSARNPAGRIGTADDIANAVLFALTSSFLTGQTLHIDGGEALT